jgi:Secretion system C-terminal sorting domain
MKKIITSLLIVTSSVTIAFSQMGLYPQLSNQSFELIDSEDPESNYFVSWTPTVASHDTTFLTQVSASYPVSGKAVGLKTSYTPEEIYYENIYQNIALTPSEGQSVIKPAYLVGAYNFSSVSSTISAQVSVEGFLDGKNIFGAVNLTRGEGVFSVQIDATPCAGKGCNGTNYLVVYIASCGNCTSISSAPTSGTDYLLVDEVKFSESALSSIFDSKEKNTLTFYPNPATAQVTVSEFSEVLDLQGNTVAQGNGKLDISGLNNGLYIIKSEKGTSKLIKE